MSADLDRAIGRCLMVGLRGARPGDAQLESDLAACERAHVRGVILFDVDLPTRDRGGLRNIESPAQVKDLIAHIKATLGAGTIVGIDQEGGRVARLRPERGFRASKSAAELGAMSAEARRAEAGAEAAQLAELGIDLNFAPCVDLGDHAENPIITRLGRALGAEPGDVAARARDVVEAHLAAGVIPCLKHFPGHGSTTVDSHLDLPDITLTWNPYRDLNPFRVMAAAFPRVPIMTGHLLHRFTDAEHPASLSRAMTSDLLRGACGFGGVIVTDSIDMGAITRRWAVHEAGVMALKAGADLVLHGFNSREQAPDAMHPAPAMAAAIRAAIDTGGIEVESLRVSAARVDAMCPDPDA